MRHYCILTLVVFCFVVCPVLAAADLVLTLPSGVTLTPGQQAAFPVTLNQPALGGLFLTLTSSDPSKVTITPDTVMILSGTTTPVRMPQVTGVGFGSATISVSGYNLTGDSKTVSVVGSGAIVLSGNNLNVGQSASYPITLSSPAPAGGATVALSVSDPSTLSLSSSSIFVSAGTTTPAVQPTITGLKAGSATITASASGYSTATQTIQVQSAQATAALSFSPNSLNVSAGTSASFVLNLSPAQPTPTTITLSNSNPAAATLPTSVTIGAGSTSVGVSVTALGAGTATIAAASSSPAVSGTSATITVTTGQDILMPSSLSVAPGQDATLPVSLAQPAPGGIFIILQTSDPTKISVSPSTIMIPLGSTTPFRPVTVTGLAGGSATITAMAYNLRGGSTSVVVGTAQNLTPSTLSMTGAGTTQNLTLTLSSPAPAGGLSFNISSGNPAVASVPATVTVPANAYSATVPVTALSAGTAVIHSSNLPTYGDVTATVTVVASSGAIGLPSGVSVAVGQSASFPITLGSAASSAVTLTLTSSDTSKVGLPVTTAYIPAGFTTPVVQPTVTGLTVGSAQIKVSGSGYTEASQTVQVTGSLTFTPSSLAITGTTQQALIVNLSAPAAAPVVVTLASTNTGVATVPASVTIGTSSTSASFMVTPLTAGSTSITASAGSLSASASVTVASAQRLGSLSLPANVKLTPNQASPFPVSLSAPPSSNLTVTLSSSSPAVTISPTTIQVPAGTLTPTPQPQVTGAAFGTASITATAPGYDTAIQAVQVGASLSFASSSINMTGAGTSSVLLNLSVPTPTALTINLSSGNTAAVTVPASVTIPANGGSVNVPITAVGAGTATIVATPTVATVTGASTTATVTMGKDIQLPSGVVVTPGQQAAFPVTLSKPALSTMYINLSSSDPTKVTVDPATMIILSGATTTARPITVTGVSGGMASITVSAYGFVGDTQTVLVSSSGPVLPFALSPSSLTITGTGSVQTMVVTLPTAAPTGGVKVTLVSTSPTVASVPASVTVSAGQTAASFQVTGAGLGSATIRASATGYPDATASVTVGAASGIILPSNPTVSLTTPVTFNITLAQPAPAGGVYVTLTSDLSIAGVAPSPVFFPAGSTTPDPQYQVRLIAVALGTVTITASAPGYATVSQTVTVTPATATATWDGPCWYRGTIYGQQGQFQAISYTLRNAPSTLQGLLYFNGTCDGKDGADNLNDYDTVDQPGSSISGFTYHPNIVPSSAIYWFGPRNAIKAHGVCPTGLPCSGCVVYNQSTPMCN